MPVLVFFNASFTQPQSKGLLLFFWQLKYAKSQIVKIRRFRRNARKSAFWAKSEKTGFGRKARKRRTLGEKGAFWAKKALWAKKAFWAK
jgi:hypothetical protein